ncbi:MAG: DNA-3-methyladenine glycosylase I [Spirochaetaceae bacterium]
MATYLMKAVDLAMLGRLGTETLAPAGVPALATVVDGTRDILRPMEVTRCPWCGDDPVYVEYHDKEWGVPVHEERRHFEFILLEGAQAGLSWITVLKRREGYRSCFEGFDPERVAQFREEDIQRLRGDTGIIRNERKIRAAVKNARAFLAIQKEFGSFDSYIWHFVEGRPIVNEFREMAELPAETELSRKISKDLKSRGFSFVGPTIIYAHMQATGLVNDHLVSCFRHRELIGAT